MTNVVPFLHGEAPLTRVAGICVCVVRVTGVACVAGVAVVAVVVIVVITSSVSTSCWGWINHNRSSNGYRLQINQTDKYICKRFSVSQQFFCLFFVNMTEKSY